MVVRVNDPDMDPAVLREDMVDSLESEAKGHVTSGSLSVAMREVPRHEFVDGSGAYEDVTREVHGSTVLSPSTVAQLFEPLAVGSTDSVLIVGAGVGYTAAVAAELCDPQRVHAVDIDRRLVITARRNLGQAGYREVLVDCRDGAHGLREYAPYDRILVEAAAVKPPQALLDQLAPSGHLVMPTGIRPQRIVTHTSDGTASAGAVVRFKPLLVEGEQGGALERNRTAREDLERARRADRTRAGWEHEWLEWPENHG